MTLQQISDYCELMDCRVTLGSPEAGYITVDGTGVVTPFNNYRRFLAFHELDHLPDPEQVLSRADVFRVSCADGERRLDREAFAKEVERALGKVLEKEESGVRS
ncbi:MAG: hypothetical protein Kow00109_12770 [Acidobacteriota bacterium]